MNRRSKDCTILPEADELFRRASEQWDSGKLRSAFCIFLNAAKRDDPGAQHNLGYFYDLGIGVKPNHQAALRWYKQAFRHGYSNAATNIGTIYRDGGRSDQAALWFQRAIRSGDADANLEMAKLLLLQRRTSDAILCLKRTINAKKSDVTEGSKDEARRLLNQFKHKGSSFLRPKRPRSKNL